MSYFDYPTSTSSAAACSYGQIASVSHSSSETSTYASKPSEFFPCAHTNTIKHKSKLNCFTCGLLLHDNGVKSYKSVKMTFGAHFDPSRYLTSALKKRIPKINLSADSEYLKQRSSLIELIAETSEKLRVTPNTMHLSVMFLDLVMSRVPSISVHSYPVYAATSVMLAAKSIELDERIPFISKLQRYSGLNTYKPREFASAEQILLRELNWNLQCVTAIDVLEYYLSQGVVFSTDSIIDETSTDDNSNALKDKSNMYDFITPTAKQTGYNKSNEKSDDDAKDFTTALGMLSIGEKENSNSISSASSRKRTVFVGDLPDSRIHAIVKKIEKDYIKLSNLIIRDNRFYEFDLQLVCGASIAFLRKVSGLTTAWTKELFEISNKTTTETAFAECLALIEQRFRHHFSPIPVLPPAQSQATKRGLISPNMMARDQENQNKPPSTPLTSTTTPQKFLVRTNTNNNTSSGIPSYANSSAHSSSTKTTTTTLGGAAKQLFTNNTSAHGSSQQLSSLNVNLPTSQLQSKLKNGSAYTSSNVSYNGAGGSSSSTSTSGLGVNQNIYSSGSAQNIQQSAQSSYIRSNAHHHTSYQPNSYLGLMRFGSNIL